MEKFPNIQKELINRFAYLSTESRKYVYCIDDARFMNHSTIKNNLDVIKFPGEIETRAIANRDTEIGEEILMNYKTFDEAHAESSEVYLNN